MGTLAAILIVLTLGLPAHAQEKEPFTKVRFDSLQSADALVLVDIFADWCPTCAIQQKVLKAYQEEHPEVPLHILQVNFLEWYPSWVARCGLLVYPSQPKGKYPTDRSPTSDSTADILRAVETVHVTTTHR